MDMDETEAAEEYVQPPDDEALSRYVEVSPSAAVMFPMSIGLMTFLLASTLVVILVLGLYSNPLTSVGLALLVLFLLFMYSFAGYCIHDGMKEYRYQREHGIRWTKRSRR